MASTADAIAGLAPLSGHTITHFTIRSERGISPLTPVVDELAPLYHVRSDAPPVLLVTGDRELEMFGRYEENAYLARMFKLAGHTDTTFMKSSARPLRNARARPPSDEGLHRQALLRQD
jgi:hypothetical protein